jgi:hypothetical protein
MLVLREPSHSNSCSRLRRPSSRPLRCYCFVQLLGQATCSPWPAANASAACMDRSFPTRNKVVRHLITQGQPECLEAVTAEEPTDEDGAVFDFTAGPRWRRRHVLAEPLKSSSATARPRLPIFNAIGYNRATSLNGWNSKASSGKQIPPANAKFWSRKKKADAGSGRQIGPRLVILTEKGYLL